MYLGIATIACSLIYSILISVIYFSKKRIKNSETELYSFLNIINIINMIFELLCCFTVYNMDQIPFITKIVNRAFLVIIFTWQTVFTLYIFKISYKEKIDIKTNHKQRLAFIEYILVALLFLILLPLEYYNKDDIVYSYGASTMFLYAIILMYFISWIVCFVKARTKDNKRKYLPVLGLIIIMGLALFIRLINPGFLIISFSFAFVTNLMFFTIENPDLQLLEEIHDAKEISDNSNEEKAMFLYNMTNEIRQITKDIDNSNEAIDKEINNKNINKELVNTYVGEIRESISKFTTMTNEILDISQVDINNLKVYNERYNIKLIIKELIQIYKKQCDNKQIEFRSVIDTDLAEYLYGDSVSLKKVLTTLLDNSIKYTEKGYIEISISQIIKRDICRLVITIEDSGTGINASKLNKIFNATKEEKEDKYNLDDNLYNAKKLITLMGGTIIPNSVESVGTKMKIVLDQRIASDEKTIDKYEKIIDKKRILLVDDSEASAKIISKLLNDTNIELEIVNTGKEALDKIRDKEKYDLILLDEEMKPLDGLTVMKKLKEIRTFNTKVILLTKNNNYEYNDEYLEYGFSNYLLKPIDKEKLFKAIKEQNLCL